MTAPKQGRVAFYCVCDERYFLGAVGMINSLRLVGHTEPIFMLDAGLTPAQRELLAAHVSLVQGHGETLPWLLKTVAPLRHPADVMVLIDADMIVTRPLGEPIENASRGKVVAFRAGYERFFGEWGELLGLGKARPRPYLSSGLVALGGSPGSDVLRLMDECQARVESDLPRLGDFFQTLDQDVLNAILCTRVDPDRIVALDYHLAPTPPFEGVRLVDEGTLRCAYADRAQPYVIHYLETRRQWNNLPSRKPWLVRAHHDVYSRLLARLLLGEDASVRVPEGDVPLRMRKGLLARAERTRVSARDLLGGQLRKLLPGSLVARIDAFRYQRAAGDR